MLPNIVTDTCASVLDLTYQSNRSRATLSELVAITPSSSNLHNSLIDTALCRLVNGNCPDITITPSSARGRVSETFLLKSPKFTLFVKRTPFSPHLSFGDLPTSSPYTPQSEGECFGTLHLTNRLQHYISLDEFTNETVIAYIVHLIFEQLELNKKGFDFYVRYYYGASCGQYGYDLLEYCDLGTLRDFAYLPPSDKYRIPFTITEPQTIKRYTNRTIYVVQPAIINGLLSQLVVCLFSLTTNIEFVSGDMKVTNILMKSEPVKGKYRQLTLDSPVKVKVSDFGKSSCTIYRQTDNSYLRIFGYSLAANVYNRFTTGHPEVKKEEGSPYNYYTIDSTFVAQIYARLRHSPLPYYRSFDYYCLMISLLSLPGYYYPFFSTPDLISTFWDPMWISSQDALSAQTDIYDVMASGQEVDTPVILALLKNKRLRCSVLEIIVGK